MATRPDLCVIFGKICSRKASCLHLSEMNLKAECHKIGEDVQTNIYDIIAFATMAKHHRAMQSSRSHGLAKTVHEAFMQMHGCLSETLSVGLQFYVIGDYMSQYDAGVAVMPRKAFLGKRVPLKTIVYQKASGT